MRHLIASAGIVAVTLLFGCGPGEEIAQVGGTPSSPGTDGQITVEPRPQWGNAYITLKLTHITPPERLAAGSTTFVVWDRRAGRAMPIGVLKFDPETREGSFEGSTTAGQFEIVVTAERTANPPSPSEHVLLSRAMRGRSGT
jgi:hypothetical protein